MRTNGNVIRVHEVPSFASILQSVKEWAKENIDREKIAAAALVVGTVAASGFFLLTLHQAMQNYTMAGF